MIRRLIDLLKTEQVALVSPFPPVECEARLGAVVEADRILSWRIFSTSRPVRGRVTKTNLSLRKAIGYRNSFQSILTASTRPHGSGKLIRGECGMSPFVMVFMGLWCCGVGLIGGAIFLDTLFGPDPFSAGHIPVLLAPPGMLLGGFFIVLLSRHFARKEARFLVGFVAETLHAEPLGGDEKCDGRP